MSRSLLYRILCTLSLSFSLYTCSGVRDDSGAASQTADESEWLQSWPEEELNLGHARGLRVWQGHQYKRVWIKSPSTNAEETAWMPYLLLDSNCPLPENLYADHRRIRVPLKRVVCVSTTHAAMFAMLDQRRIMVGMSWGENLYDPQLRQLYEKGHLREVSREGNLDMESILDLEPDLVLTYLTADPEYGEFRKMQQLGLPVMPIAEFMEEHPLGQAEWLRLGGWLLGQSALADSLYAGVEQHYAALRLNAQKRGEKPSVFSGLDFQGNWTVPRAESFAAAFLSDAGAAYVWADAGGKGSLSVDFEQVFERASEADFWVHPGAARSLSELQQRNVRLRHFKAVRMGRVYNNDARLSPGGGNDYWESATFRPDRVLEDLISIFQGGGQEPDELFYYRRLPQ